MIPVDSSRKVVTSRKRHFKDVSSFHKERPPFFIIDGKSLVDFNLESIALNLAEVRIICSVECQRGGNAAL